MSMSNDPTAQIFNYGLDHTLEIEPSAEQRFTEALRGAVSMLHVLAFLTWLILIVPIAIMVWKAAV